MFYFVILWLYASYQETATATIAARLQAGTVIILQFLALLCPKSVPLCDRLTLRDSGSIIVFDSHFHSSTPLTVIPGLLVSWPSAHAHVFGDVESTPSVLGTDLIVYTGFPLAVIPELSTPSDSDSDYAVATVSGLTVGSTRLGKCLIDSVAIALLVWLVSALLMVCNANQNRAEEVLEVYPEWAYVSEPTLQAPDFQSQLLDFQLQVRSADTIAEVDQTPVRESVFSKLFQFIVAINFAYAATICPPPAALLDAAICLQEANITISTLSLDVTSLSNTNDILRTENASQQHTISILDNEVATLGASLETSNSEVLRFQGENGKLVEEIGEKNEEIKEKDAQLDEQKARTADVTAERDEEFKKNAELRAKNDALEDANARLVAENAETQQTLADNQFTVKSQRREIIELKQDKIGLHDRVAKSAKALQESKAEAEDDRLDLITKCRETQSAKFQLEYKLKDAHEHNDSLKTHNGEIQASFKQRFQKQEDAHASQLAAIGQELQTARADKADAQQREVQVHIALYEERDTAESDRERANTFAEAYVQEKAQTSRLKEVGRSLLADYYKAQEECNMYKTQLSVIRSSILTRPSTEDEDATPFFIPSSSSSTTSLAALASTSTENIMAIQLPTMASTPPTPSIALEDLKQSCAQIVTTSATEGNDPFDSDPMLAMPTFRITRSAPPTPSRKTVIQRHMGYYVLAPSLSMPIDMDVRFFD